MTGELIAGRYEVEAVLGTGGMSTVYRARDRELQRTVAVKLLDPRWADDPEFVGRFRDEARAAARLTHPNVVGVLDRGIDEGREYIVFEHVEGETLKQIVAREGPLPPERAAGLGCGVSRALAAAHAAGIVHRDVKAQNILVGADGRPRVTDFGVARVPDAEQRTETGAIVGTGTYIAPEQAQGERVSGAADVYALGVVLYELVVGTPPFDGANPVTVAMRHVNDPVPRVAAARADCPPELATLIESCLAKDPAARPAPGDVAVRLERLARGAAEPSAEEDRTLVISRRPAPRRSAPRRRRTVLLAVGAALAAAVLAAVLLARGVGDTGAGTPVDVAAIASHDPVGGDGERDDTVALATDGDRSTFWTTEGYDDFRGLKDGVGIVLDVGEERPLAALSVESDLPGFTAEVRRCEDAGCVDSTLVAESRLVDEATTWDLDGLEARYLLLWLTDLALDTDGKERAHVNEVTVTG
jgi:predicted Ser/Thr protein kinase